MKGKEVKQYIPVEVLNGLSSKAKRAISPERKLVLSQTFEVVEMIFNSQREGQTSRI